MLNRANVEDIEIILTRNRLRWLGHVSRMENDRPVKELLFGELDNGTRSLGRPKLRYKDTCKSILRDGQVLDDWQQVVYDRPPWRVTIKNTCKILNKERVDQYKQKKEQRARKRAAKVF